MVDIHEHEAEFREQLDREGVMIWYNVPPWANELFRILADRDTFKSRPIDKTDDLEGGEHG